jgi:5-methylcytosine-specific restriction endonuclease McrA
MPIPTGDTQICRDCGKKLPIDRFSRSGRTDGYRRPECRSCQTKRSKEINPNYQYTPGAIAAREAHAKLPRSEINLLKKAKLRLQQAQCVYCTAGLDDQHSHLDHRTPLSRGGTNDAENLQLLCARCNSEKHAKTHTEYLTWLRASGAHLAPDRRGKLVY